MTGNPILNEAGAQVIVPSSDDLILDDFDDQQISITTSQK